MVQFERSQGTVLKKIARRVEDILQAARDRERRGQHLALEIDARFRLQDLGAVQFQLASAILEEAGGLGQEEVVSELLSLGLAAVLDGAAKAASVPVEGGFEPGEENALLPRRAMTIDLPRPKSSFESRTVN
jgi:hypothetical protein